MSVMAILIDLVIVIVLFLHGITCNSAQVQLKGEGVCIRKGVKSCCSNFKRDGVRCIPCIGWFGDGCSLPCDKGMYGFGCLSKCNCSSCDRVDGTCFHIGKHNGTSENDGEVGDEYLWVAVLVSVLLLIIAGLVAIIFVFHYLRERKEVDIQISKLLRRTVISRILKNREVPRLSTGEVGNSCDDPCDEEESYADIRQSQMIPCKDVTNKCLGNEKRTRRSNTSVDGGRFSLLERTSYAHTARSSNTYNSLNFNRKKNIPSTIGTPTCDIYSSDAIRELPLENHSIKSPSFSEKDYVSLKTMMGTKGIQKKEEKQSKKSLTVECDINECDANVQFSSATDNTKEEYSSCPLSEHLLSNMSDSFKTNSTRNIPIKSSPRAFQNNKFSAEGIKASNKNTALKNGFALKPALKPKPKVTIVSNTLKAESVDDNRPYSVSSSTG